MHSHPYFASRKEPKQPYRPRLLHLFGFELGGVTETIDSQVLDVARASIGCVCLQFIID